MRRLVRASVGIALALLGLAGVTWGWLSATAATATDLSQFKRGDIVFHTSGSRQSLAILLASSSAYSHMGLIDFEPDGAAVVLEASATTRATPLAQWVARGVGGRIAVYRLPGLTDATARGIAEAARAHFGKRYDLFFLNGDNELYCSELVHLAYRAGAGVELGRFQPAGSLGLDNFAARRVIEQRWQRHPLCTGGKAKNFEACLAIIKQQPLVTPRSIAEDGQLQRIYSNYALSAE
jgi:Permuted papain-like amidase enzyme, YaeF/YiiX, C92 family